MAASRDTVQKVKFGGDVRAICRILGKRSSSLDFPAEKLLIGVLER
jgi:hypothetical protein